MKISKLSENLKPSAILQLAADIRELIANGKNIYNLTIGDFNPDVFQIPEGLKADVIHSYQSENTNYPPGNGELSLRKSVSDYLKRNLNLDYNENEIMVSGGARPLLYAAYQTLLDPGDTVLYPAPSWNNDAFTYLARNKAMILETKAENKFLPTAEEIAPHIKDVNLISLCSPLNPTGTIFDKEELEKICSLIVEENIRREKLDMKPLYLIYDQIYWQLTYGDRKHYHPVILRPELRDCTISIDGISKAFAATGVRVGWATGPAEIIKKMVSLLTHVGAWAPKPEQIAVAEFLNDENGVKSFLKSFRERLSFRLNEFYKGFKQMAADGFPVFAIDPEAALYMTLKFDLVGRKTKEGKTIQSIPDVTQFLLNKANVALVPFTAFGAAEKEPWYRLSIGTVKKEEISIILNQIKSALELLKPEEVKEI